MKMTSCMFSVQSSLYVTFDFSSVVMHHVW